MTDEQIRIKIAEACGWTFNKESEIGGHHFPEWWTHPDGRSAHLPCELPNYLQDLNACHEMEKVLTERQLWLADILEEKIIEASRGLV